MTVSDLKILSAIINKSDNIGIIKMNGCTKKIIEQKTKLSKTKINTTLRMLLSEGYIEKGLNKGNQHTFVVTNKGLKLILEMNGKLKGEY